jgi:hypothetical protein
MKLKKIGFIILIAILIICRNKSQKNKTLSLNRNEEHFNKLENDFLSNLKICLITDNSRLINSLLPDMKINKIIFTNKKSNLNIDHIEYIERNEIIESIDNNIDIVISSHYYPELFYSCQRKGIKSILYYEEMSIKEIMCPISLFWFRKNNSKNYFYKSYNDNRIIANSLDKSLIECFYRMTFGYHLSMLYRFSDNKYITSNKNKNLNFQTKNKIDQYIDIDDCMIEENKLYTYYLYIYVTQNYENINVRDIKINFLDNQGNYEKQVDNLICLKFYDENNEGEYKKLYNNRIHISVKNLNVSCIQFLKVPKKKNIIFYVGNFKPLESTENHISQDSQKNNSIDVINIQENHIVYFNHLIELISRTCNIFFVLYTRTWSFITLDNLKYLKSLNIKSCSYHLDLYYPLKRKNSVIDDPFWLTDKVFITDCDPKAIEYYKTVNNNIFELYAGVHSKDIYMKPKIGFEHDIAFVGSGSVNGDYHEEWGYRKELLKFLYTFPNFVKKGRPQQSIRNNELNSLYSKTKIIIGDCINIGFKYEKYWSDRVYETIGRGGFLIFPYIKGIEKEFQDKKHIVYYEYGNFKQLRNLINYYLENEKERETIRKKGFEHCKKNFSYCNRIQDIIQKFQPVSPFKSIELLLLNQNKEILQQKYRFTECSDFIDIKNIPSLNIENIKKNIHKTIKTDLAVINFYKINLNDKKEIEDTLKIKMNDIIVEKEYIISESLKCDLETGQFDNRLAKDMEGLKVELSAETQMVRETESLLKLYKKKHFPILLSKNNYNKIMMTYCGEDMDENIPVDWKQQINTIIKELEKSQIFHNDMWKGNFLVYNNIIHIIDFGWSTIKEFYPFSNIQESELSNVDNLKYFLDTKLKESLHERIEKIIS